MYHPCGFCKPRCNHPCKSRLYSPRWIECPECKTFILAGNKKCINCGAKVEVRIEPVFCSFSNELCDKPCGLVNEANHDPTRTCLYLEAREQSEQIRGDSV